MEQYRQVLRLRPNDGETYNRIGSVQRRQALWRESLASFRKAEELDPTNLGYVGVLTNHLAAGRRFDEAIARVRRYLELGSTLQRRFNLAFLHYLAKGSTQEMDEFFAGLSAAQLNSNTGVALRNQWALRHGDLDEAIRLDRGTDANVGSAIDMAIVFAVRGDRQAVNDRLAKWVDGLRNPSQTDGSEGNYRSQHQLAVVEALLGRKEEALRAANAAIERGPESRDAFLGVRNRGVMAFVHAWTGDKDAANAEYAHILRAPYGSAFLSGGGNIPQASIHTMKRDPVYAPLQGDPRFKALLNDPKNNAPLF
jgi:tetratricopeptide (TPR) repeat protein